MLATLGARAEVVPFNVFLASSSGSTPSSYTIPAGKVYIIEGVVLAHNAGTPTETQIRVSIDADNITAGSFLTIKISDTYALGSFVWMPQPFRLKAGETLEVPQNATYFICRYFGLLIDEADLYAQEIPVELQSVGTQGGQLLAGAKYGSPRPRITTIESAVDVSDFTEDTTGVEVAGVTRDEAEVSVEQSGDAVKFMRVRAVARN